LCGVAGLVRCARCVVCRCAAMVARGLGGSPRSPLAPRFHQVVPIPHMRKAATSTRRGAEKGERHGNVRNGTAAPLLSSPLLFAVPFVRSWPPYLPHDVATWMRRGAAIRVPTSVYWGSPTALVRERPAGDRGVSRQRAAHGPRYRCIQVGQRVATAQLVMCGRRVCTFHRKRSQGRRCIGALIFDFIWFSHGRLFGVVGLIEFVRVFIPCSFRILSFIRVIFS